MLAGAARNFAKVRTFPVHGRSHENTTEAKPSPWFDCSDAAPAGRGIAMVARALWKGQLRLSLVLIPVELFSATRSGASISFRQIHKPSGKPIHYEKGVEGVGPVDVDVIVKGFEYEDDRYVLLDPKEISGNKADKELLEVAAALIERKTAPFHAAAFKDNYAAALRDLVKRKMKGKSARVEVEEGERPQRRSDNVVDLMAALKKSLEGNEPKKKTQAKAQSSSRRSRRRSA